MQKKKRKKEIVNKRDKEDFRFLDMYCNLRVTEVS